MMKMAAGKDYFTYIVVYQKNLIFYYFRIYNWVSNKKKYIKNSINRRFILLWNIMNLAELLALTLVLTKDISDLKEKMKNQTKILKINL